MKILKKQLIHIIREELLKEQVDHEGVRDVVNSASKLMSALNVFMGNAPETVLKPTHKYIKKINSLLEDMINNPSSYVMPKAPENQDKKEIIEPAKEESQEHMVSKEKKTIIPSWK